MDRDTYNVRPSIQPLSHRTAWKVYAVLVILINFATIVGGGLSMSNIVGGAVSLVLCAPLVGYVWQRALVPSWIGKIAFVLGLFSIPVVLITSSSRHGATGFLIAAVMLLLYAPLLRATFLYGYRSNHLWSGVSTAQ